MHNHSERIKFNYITKMAKNCVFPASLSRKNLNWKSFALGSSRAKAWNSWKFQYVSNRKCSATKSINCKVLSALRCDYQHFVTAARCSTEKLSLLSFLFMKWRKLKLRKLCIHRVFVVTVIKAEEARVHVLCICKIPRMCFRLREANKKKGWRLGWGSFCQN